MRLERLTWGKTVHLIDDWMDGRMDRLDGWMDCERTNLLWLRSHEKSEIGEVNMGHNSSGKTVHLPMGSCKLLHLDWNIT